VLLPPGVRRDEILERIVRKGEQVPLGVRYWLEEDGDRVVFRSRPISDEELYVTPWSRVEERLYYGTPPGAMNEYDPGKEHFPVPPAVVAAQEVAELLRAEAHRERSYARTEWTRDVMLGIREPEDEPEEDPNGGVFRGIAIAALISLMVVGLAWVLNDWLTVVN
jgi:hypothetical protein